MRRSFFDSIGGYDVTFGHRRCRPGSAALPRARSGGDAASVDDLDGRFGFVCNLHGADLRGLRRKVEFRARGIDPVRQRNVHEKLLWNLHHLAGHQFASRPTRSPVADGRARPGTSSGASLRKTKRRGWTGMLFRIGSTRGSISARCQYLEQDPTT